MFGEIEKKVIEDFLSLVANLGHHEDLMIESSNKTIGSYIFETDNLNVIAGYPKDNQSFRNILCGDENC